MLFLFFPFSSAKCGELKIIDQNSQIINSENLAVLVQGAENITINGDAQIIVVSINAELQKPNTITAKNKEAHPTKIKNSTKEAAKKKLLTKIKAELLFYHSSQDSTNFSVLSANSNSAIPNSKTQYAISSCVKQKLKSDAISLYRENSLFKDDTKSAFQMKSTFFGTSPPFFC